MSWGHSCFELKYDLLLQVRSHCICKNARVVSFPVWQPAELTKYLSALQLPVLPSQCWFLNLTLCATGPFFLSLFSGLSRREKISVCISDGWNLSRRHLRCRRYIRGYYLFKCGRWHAQIFLGLHNQSLNLRATVVECRNVWWSAWQVCVCSLLTSQWFFVFVLSWLASGVPSVQ